MMEMLYSDRDLAVCVKPVGLDSEHEVPEELKKILGGDIFPIHRLDKNVGGVMVFARSKAAAAQLSKLVQDGALVKEYVAQVHGTPPETGDWTDFLFKDSTKRCKKGQTGICDSGTLCGAHPSAHRPQSPDPCPVCFPGFSAGGGSQVWLPG